MIQAELTELETLSRRLGACSGEVDDLKRALTTLIGTTTWTGRAAERFRTAWEAQFSPALKDLSDALVQASQEVDNRRVAIDHAAN